MRGLDLESFALHQGGQRLEHAEFDEGIGRVTAFRGEVRTFPAAGVAEWPRFVVDHCLLLK
jgi:hypothetical protein